MSKRPRAPFALASLLVLLALLAASSVSASHYRLAKGFELVTESERKALKRANIATTAQLLKATAKKRGRRALAKSTKLPVKRLKELATQCDLLRIKGLGPSAVRLLQAARVKDVTALKRTQAQTLHNTLQTLKSTRVVPTAAELAEWIAQAKTLRRVLEGTR
jgi:hypothetical protein